jgi:hypothetical protein
MHYKCSPTQWGFQKSPLATGGIGVAGYITLIYEAVRE